MNNLGYYLGACALALVAALLISGAVIVHNPAHYGGHSLAMTALVMGAIEIIVGLIVWLFEGF